MTPILRAVDLADGDVLHAIFIEPGVKQFLFDGIAPSRAETERHVVAARAQGGWVIDLDGEIVGLASLRPVGAGDRELMIVVSERWWGRGVAFAAAQAALGHGLAVLGLDRILATVDLPNERSHRLMRRLGFVAVGESDGPMYRATDYVLTRPGNPATAISNRSEPID